MDRPRCEICGAETQWYGWIQGWLCPVCQGDEQEEEDKDEASENQQRQQKE